jgi:hypothetical protein
MGHWKDLLLFFIIRPSTRRSSRVESSRIRNSPAKRLYIYIPFFVFFLHYRYRSRSSSSSSSLYTISSSLIQKKKTRLSLGWLLVAQHRLGSGKTRSGTRNRSWRLRINACIACMHCLWLLNYF